MSNRTDEIVTAALDCLLWLGTDDEGVPLEAHGFTIHDVIEADVEKLRDMLQAFVGSNAEDLEGLDAGAIGHDFILTANRHGAGFWDRGLGERGQRLTEAAHPYGELILYTAGAGKLYIQGV